MPLDIIDKVSGSILGFSIGEALGIPTIGMTPYTVFSRFNKTDSYFMADNGKQAEIGDESASLIIFSRAEIENITIESLKENKKINSLITPYAYIIPKALKVAIQQKSRHEIGTFCREIPGNSSIQDSLCRFIFGNLIKEIFTGFENEGPFALYEGPNSFLTRMIQLAFDAEQKDPTFNYKTSIGERLLFTRNKLMKLDNTVPMFIGINGNTEELPVLLTNAIFLYMRAPDAFSTVIEAASVGGASSKLASMVGCLVGTTIGISKIPPEFRTDLCESVQLEALAIKFANACQVIEEQSSGQDSDE